MSAITEHFFLVVMFVNAEGMNDKSVKLVENSSAAITQALNTFAAGYSDDPTFAICAHVVMSYKRTMINGEEFRSRSIEHGQVTMVLSQEALEAKMRSNQEEIERQVMQEVANVFGIDIANVKAGRVTSEGVTEITPVKKTLH